MDFQLADFRVQVYGDYGDPAVSVHLIDANGEIVSWTSDEWESEPSLVAKIVEAVCTGFSQGPTTLREYLNKPAGWA